MAAAAPVPVPVLPRLAAAVPRGGVVGPARLALRQYLADCDRDLAGAFRDGAAATDLVRARAEAVRRVLAYVWQSWLGDSGEASLLAVGGFGRGELFPHSDVDLLILTVPDPPPRLLRAIEAFATCLWDIGLKPGLAVRDLAGCRALAAADVGVYTNLLEARWLEGARALAGSLLGSLPDEGLWAPARFLAVKQAEQAARHLRFGDTAYNLEPQLKEGPGGLRDLQMIGWLGRAIAGSGEHAAMAEAGLLDAVEVDALAAARATLFRIREALHLLARRSEERLLFDYQRELAAALGYRDEHADNLAVEQCMQDYFRAARRISAINEELLARCSEMLAPPHSPTLPLAGGFARIGDRLDVVDAARLRTQPQALIELYALFARESGVRGLRANAMRLVRLCLADEGFDLEHPAVYAALRDLLELGAPAVESLAAMARHGVLARLVPGFARVTGRMQYDLFHVYTVDEHTLRVLRFIARFAGSEGADAFPLAHAVFRRLPKVSLLLLAGLFHDIAKGRGGDHSVLGEDDARAFCTKLGLGSAAVERVAWLVRWHLLMSVVAQRQDITDAAVVERFAEQVGDWERLDYLYLLTVADINGTSPKLWNGWRDRLLADLYAATRYVLREEAGELPQADERMAETRQQATAILVARGIGADTAARVLDGFPDESFLRYRPEQVAWQAGAMATHDDPARPLVRVLAEGGRGTSEVFVHMRDRDGLFSTITAVLARFRLEVVEARLLAGRADTVFDTFYLLDASGRPLAGVGEVAALEAALRDALSRDVLDELPPRRTVPRALRHFHIAAHLTFSSEQARTRVGLVCSDRPGLLASVAQAFRATGVRVHDARIATFGERVEDFFLVTDTHDRPLDAATGQKLREALGKRLDAASASAPGTQHGKH